MENNDRLRRQLTLGCALALAARATVFSSGGAGGLVSVAVFWIFSLAIAVFAVRQFAFRMRFGGSVPVLKWGLLLGLLLAFASAALLVDARAGKEALFAVTLGCVIALVFLAVRDSFRNRARA